MPERYFSAVIIQIYAWKAFQRGIQNTSKICYSKKRKVEEGNMATIKEIAEKLGISTTTVSNVIHGKTGKMSAVRAWTGPEAWRNICSVRDMKKLLFSAMNGWSMGARRKNCRASGRFWSMPGKGWRRRTFLCCPRSGFCARKFSGVLFRG